MTASRDRDVTFRSNADQVLSLITGRSAFNELTAWLKLERSKEVEWFLQMGIDTVNVTP